MNATLHHTTVDALGDVSRESIDPHALRPEEAIRLLRHAPWRRLAVLGDSIAEGVGDSVAGYADVPWAGRLAAGLGAAVGETAYLNVGARGLLAGEIRATQLDAVVSFGPDLAVVSAGPNDMLRRSFDPGAVEAELDTIVAPLARGGALVVTFGLFDLSRASFIRDAHRDDLRHRITTLNAVTRTVTERRSGVHVDFFDHPALDDALFSADGIHPNRRGHAYIAGDVIRALGATIRPRRLGRPEEGFRKAASRESQRHNQHQPKENQ